VSSFGRYFILSKNLKNKGWRPSQEQQRRKAGENGAFDSLVDSNQFSDTQSTQGKNILSDACRRFRLQLLFSKLQSSKESQWYQ
jgi:hypothetical protein